MARIISFMSLYIICSNLIIAKYLYDMKQKTECKDTPMFSLVYDYYLLELGVAITTLLFGLFVLHDIPYSHTVVNISTSMLNIVMRMKNLLMLMAFITSCVFFLVLRELSNLKSCFDIHPFLTYYLMYNSSSNILTFIYLGAMMFVRK
jgi:hypothetical protein